MMIIIIANIKKRRRIYKKQLYLPPQGLFKVALATGPSTLLATPSLWLIIKKVRQKVHQVFIYFN